MSVFVGVCVCVRVGLSGCVKREVLTEADKRPQSTPAKQPSGACWIFVGVCVCLCVCGQDGVAGWMEG